MQTSTLFASKFRDQIERGVGLLILAAKDTNAPVAWRKKAGALADAGAKVMAAIEASEAFESASAAISITPRLLAVDLTKA